MAVVDDTWHRTINGRKVRTGRWGKGVQWRVRWRDEAGWCAESFEVKADADLCAAEVADDMLRDGSNGRR